MRILFLGDIVGKSGRMAFFDLVPELRRRWSLDCVIVNGENSAHGYGITEAIAKDLIDAGADAITLGNHSWDQREALVFIEREHRLVRPINFPPGTLCGLAVETDDKTGLAIKISPVRIGPHLEQVEPAFWTAVATP